MAPKYLFLSSNSSCDESMYPKRYLTCRKIILKTIAMFTISSKLFRSNGKLRTIKHLNILQWNLRAWKTCGYILILFSTLWPKSVFIAGTCIVKRKATSNSNRHLKEIKISISLRQSGVKSHKIIRKTDLHTHTHTYTFKDYKTTTTMPFNANDFMHASALGRIL